MALDSGIKNRFLLGAVALAAVAMAGCGGPNNETPTACLEGPELFLDKGSGSIRISDCLAENQTAGELATVGAAMIDAATELNAEARADPGGSANLQLGYLLGAAQRGAEETSGIHAELIRRLAVAARYSPGNLPQPPAFTRAYRRGYDAGNTRG